MDAKTAHIFNETYFPKIKQLIRNKLPAEITADDLDGKAHQAKAVYLHGGPLGAGKYEFPIALTIFWNPHTVKELVKHPGNKMRRFERHIAKFLKNIETYTEVDFASSSQHGHETLGIPGPDFEDE
ncbi:hypothetical protein [Undibacterium terreum]|uniref:Uncharacterized protein n=1 Tax=Undibacterium terreum TaxID=1224302 RepID=A0A916V0J4_9BURK|nr:hypothetical protein [Undibacterium terreum]GGC98840.1 hypothetical protein GCM10011396_52960 [Undibacterium terreum]